MCLQRPRQTQPDGTGLASLTPSLCRAPHVEVAELVGVLKGLQNLAAQTNATATIAGGGGGEGVTMHSGCQQQKGLEVPRVLELWVLHTTARSGGDGGWQIGFAAEKTYSLYRRH